MLVTQKKNLEFFQIKAIRVGNISQKFIKPDDMQALNVTIEVIRLEMNMDGEYYFWKTNKFIGTPFFVPAKSCATCGTTDSIKVKGMGQ